MSYMKTLFFGTGVLVWCLLGILLLLFLFELLVIGVANAFSHLRWQMKVYKVQKPEAKMGEFYLTYWWPLLCAFFSYVLEFMGYRKNSGTSYTGQGGSFWRGIGDWYEGKLLTALPTQVKNADGTFSELHPDDEDEEIEDND